MKATRWPAFVIACLVSIAVLSSPARGQSTSPSPAPSPAPASGEDPRRCPCWYDGYKSTRAENDPGNDDATGCNQRQLKAEFHDGFVAHRNGETGKCPYKR